MASDNNVIEVGSRLEPFFDRYLIDRLNNADLKLHSPTPREIAIRFNSPWEGYDCHYVTVIKDGETYHMYYRGNVINERNAVDKEVTCYAESSDGIHWVKPNVGLVDFQGSKENNIILGPEYIGITRNFTPFLDIRPGVPTAERFKGLGGEINLEGLGGAELKQSTLYRKANAREGVFVVASPDGVHWQRLSDTPILTRAHYPFRTDMSQCSTFWSEREQQYVSYIRTWKGGPPVSPGREGDTRWISRTTSPDFVTWSKVEPLEYLHDGAAAPVEHFYTNQIHPYIRAPHIYIGLPMRFLPHRKALPEHHHDGVSDGVYMSSRDGIHWDRTFLEAFIRPGRDRENWTDRTNAPVLNVVQTAPDELSVYWLEHYSWPTNHVRRGTLRLDGFASLNAGYAGGEAITHPLRFSGDKLVLNYATSAAGSLRVELQDSAGQPLPGYSLEESAELYGDQIAQPAAWQSGTDVSRWAEQPVRLRFALKDADLYSIQFSS
ncbi:MAG: hypothetical protein HY326_10105 [Chloroflexi bacterium]|nr:hypothetical protein [Chloroflexota bacterium]